MLWWSRVMLSMPACLCKRDEQGVREELAARSAAAQTGISDKLEIFFFRNYPTITHRALRAKYII